MIAELLGFLKSPENQVAVNVMIFAGGNVSGFLVSRFTMSASERSLHKQSLYENGINHAREIETRYKTFCDVFRTYANKSEATTLDDFHALSTAGDLYFGELKMASDAILQNKVDAGSRDRTFIPKIVEAYQKNIPQYYETLVHIAVKLSVAYAGKFERHNYKSIIGVIEKFAPSEMLPPAASTLSNSG